MKPVYLDHNATTPILPDVLTAMLPFLGEHFGNPSSSHPYGRRAHDAVEQARAEVAALIGADADEIVFTSGGTEANNLAIRGPAFSLGVRRVVTSVVEHPAVAAPIARLAAEGFKVAKAPVDAAGIVAIEKLAALCEEPTGLVTVMLAQNETGVVMPIAEIAAMAHCAGALVHTDAAQAVGKIPALVCELDVDLMTIAGHKLYAPKGVGALYVRRGVALSPVLLGAGHERGLRPGTENVTSIVGLGKACAIAAHDLSREMARLEVLRDRLCSRLKAGIPGLIVCGERVARLPNTLNVCFPGCRGSELLALAPEIAASTGSACHDGGEHPSAVLVAMGVPHDTALGAIRLSLGRGTTEADIDTAVCVLCRAHAQSARV